MIIILIIAAFISFIVAIYNNESFMDSIIILAIVLLNAVLGFIQELKADQAIESLKKMQVTETIQTNQRTTIIVVHRRFGLMPREELSKISISIICR